MSRQSRKHRPPIHWERSLELTIHWENEEDVMGRLVVGTGEEIGGKACFFIVFSTFLVALGEKNQPKSQQKSKPKKKTKNNKKVTKNRPPSFRSWGPKWTENGQKTGPEPKKCVWSRRRKLFFSFFAAVAVRSHSPNRILEGLTLQNCAPATVGARF